MPPGDSPSKRLVYPNHLLRASTRTPTARTRRATALSTSLTFRAVTLPLRTCARRPFGLDTALTSFPSPPSPARTHGRSGRRCRREAGSIMPAATDILSLALPRLWAAIATTAITNVDGQPYCVAHIVCHHEVLEECVKSWPHMRKHRPYAEQSCNGPLFRWKCHCCWSFSLRSSERSWCQ